MGVSKILTIDIHAPAVQGSVSSKTVFEDYQAGFVAIDWFLENIKDKSELCVVAPDAGAVKRAKEFHSNFEWHGYKDQIGLALMHKERKVANVVDSVTVIGNVKGKVCIVVDDMTDTSGTLCQAGEELKKQGAKQVYAVITHGLFSGPAPERIRNSVFEKIICSDSVSLDDSVREALGDKLEYVSLDLLLAELIRRSHNKEDTCVLQTSPKYKK